MTSARFAFQAMVVLTLSAVVSWPDARQVRAGAFRPTADAVGRRPDALGGLGALATLRGESRELFGYGQASEVRVGTQAATAVLRKLYESDIEGRRRPMPPGLQALGAKMNGIVGYARGARNAPVASARLLLRDIATGKVEAPAMTDEYGRFAFLDVMPSGYIVELLNSKGTVMGVSDIIKIGLNEIREATVRSSGRMELASFGGALRPAAQETISAASSQGVNRVTAPSRCASPPCDNSSR